jgi:hypothetical protein
MKITDPFRQPDTTTVWGIIGPPLKLVAILILSLWALMYWPDVRQWLDVTFDKGDQQRTGIVLLILFSLVFGVCCFLARRM